MKLNYKRTIFVGFAFFLISAFWQAYDNAVPLILTNKFGLSQTASGVIMALDNILALFLLPLFGTISDRCSSRRGRRTPFIVTGTVLAAVLLVALSFVDMAQLKNLSAATQEYYREDLEYFTRVMQIKYVSEFSREIMDNFVDHEMNKGNRVSAINTRIRGLRVFFNYCAEYGFIRGFKYPLIREDESVKVPYITVQLSTSMVELLHISVKFT